MIELDAMKEALESMVWQFAYHGVKNNRPVLHTGGLSALEAAFYALEWDDPHILDDLDGSCCDVDGCYEQISGSGGAWKKSGYWCCCSEHNAAARDGKPQPEMKSRAIEREARRDKKTGILL